MLCNLLGPCSQLKHMIKIFISLLRLDSSVGEHWQHRLSPHVILARLTSNHSNHKTSEKEARL